MHDSSARRHPAAGARLLATALAWWLCAPLASCSAETLLGDKVDESEFAAALKSAQWAGASPVPSGGPPDTMSPNGPAQHDPLVQPAQGFAPSLGLAFSPFPLQLALQPPPAQRTAAQAGVALGLASVPYMIGDTSAGTCFSLRGIVTADISHPTLTCSRLNISENNTALPINRIYLSYRHFENSNGLQVFQYSENFNLDQYTLGAERTFAGGRGSVELRVPIQRRLRSDLISLIAPPFNAVDVVTGSNDRETDIGNISIITKLLLLEQQNFALTAGLGVTAPTARDVSYDIAVQDTIIFPIAPGVTGDTISTFSNKYENDTVYLSPFLAWLAVPQANSRLSRWYHQGFLQVEVAANPSKLTTDGGGVTDFFFNNAPIGNVVFRTPGGLPTETDVFAQTLLRANMGVGYRISGYSDRRLISNVRALFEMHYTTTIQRANVSTVAIEELGVGAFFSQNMQAGNADPRTDILNAAAGVAANVGRLTVTNGFIAPVKRGPDRGFDFEYNLQVQLPY